MTGNDLRQKYLDFFVSKQHEIISPASLVPENDSTTLFTSSGMQPLVPYLLGQPHPSGKTRLVNSQPSFRAQDIEVVGDNRHTTFFEMLGNWSLGDYFKKEQLVWVWEFLTKKLKLPSEKLYVSVFAGGDGVPKDEESISVWRSLGIADNHIFSYSSDKNWWSRSGAPQEMPTGEIGGPDTEVFFEFTQTNHDPKHGKECHPNCDCGRFLEIANSVFIQYQKQKDGSLKELPQKNVDFGGGLERLLAAANNNPDIFSTDLFSPAKKIIEENSLGTDKNLRVILDHLKAATFIIDAQIVPSNKGQGYLLRRLIRRASVHANQANIDLRSNFNLVISEYIRIYSNQYPSLSKNKTAIISTINAELTKFESTLKKGLALIGKTSPFDLYQTYGFPPEIIEELTQKAGLAFDKQEFEKEKQKHQKLSRTASKGVFRGGLADHSEITTKYHTATHLLHAALRQIIGDHVRQTGSNITHERLRFDFTHDQPLTDRQLRQVEDLINQQIKKGLSVTHQIMTSAEAAQQNALAFFAEKYGDRVKVYSIGNFSRELCGGPHVANTAHLGKVIIYKQESIGSGRRRLYAKIA